MSQGTYRSWNVLEFKSRISPRLESPGIRPRSWKGLKSHRNMEMGIPGETNFSVISRNVYEMEKNFGHVRYLFRYKMTYRNNLYATKAALTVLKKTNISALLMWLDYGNSTLAGIALYLLKRLQLVMNSAARLVFGSSRYNHVAPLLRQLHWLMAAERIDFKLALLVYKCQQHLRTLPMNSASPRTVTLDVVYDPPRHH